MSYIIRWVGGVSAGGFDDMMRAAHAIVATGLESVVQVREQMSDRVVATVPMLANDVYTTKTLATGEREKARSEPERSELDQGYQLWDHHS